MSAFDPKRTQRPYFSMLIWTDTIALPGVCTENLVRID